MTDAPSAPASPATILVVDEEVMVRFAIADYLRDCGYRVMEAASAKEAMLVMGTPDVLVDIVLCDAALKGEVNGYASARCQPVRRRCWMRRYYVGRETVASRENGQPFFVLHSPATPIGVLPGVVFTKVLVCASAAQHKNPDMKRADASRRRRTICGCMGDPRR